MPFRLAGFLCLQKMGSYALQVDAFVPVELVPDWRVALVVEPVTAVVVQMEMLPLEA